MTMMGVWRVGYPDAAHRHFKDAALLMTANSKANAGQLFGLAAECGLKAILVACGAPTDADGTVCKLVNASGKGFRDHLPGLHAAATGSGDVLPDGRFTTRYMAMMPGLSAFRGWAVDHRYWRDDAWPATSLPSWNNAAREVMLAVDLARQDGLLT